MAHAHPPSGSSPSRTLLAGTRGSPLAVWQAEFFVARVAELPEPVRGGAVFRRHEIRTTGDATQAAGTRLADVGGKGMFAKEIHEALLDGRVDVAVHSLKDLETELPRGIVLAATLAREDARDALILPQAVTAAEGLAGLPQGALVGSSSLRRQAQMLHLRPDLRFATLRGNVAGRIGRVRGGDFGATLLAMAGLKRLGLGHEAAAVLEPQVMLPAACQGIVGVTVREGDERLVALLAGVRDAESWDMAMAERGVLGALDGSCRTPIGAHARIGADGVLHLEGLVARGDGSFLLRRSIAGDRRDAARLGAELGARLRAEAPRDVLA
jgi:hydroxymethylbilane synthase